MEIIKEQKVEKQRDQRGTPRRYRANILVAGLLLIAVGVLILGKNMGWIEPGVYRVLMSWQMLLIVLGIWSMCGRHLINGVVLAGIGAFFMIPLLAPVGSGWTATYWPFIFILLGIILLIRLVKPTRYTKGRHFDNEFNQQTISDAEEGFVDSYNSFSSTRHIVLDPVFKGARIRSSFGGTILDLKRTTLAEGETFIDVDMTCGGLELYIPDSWIVVDKVTPFMAGIEDKRYRPAADPGSAGKLVLRGNISLGGIEIKS